MKHYILILSVLLFVGNANATECPDLSAVDFGPCFMIIGWGWDGNDCIQLGGCGASDFEGNDYSEYIYWSYASCMNSCPCLEGYVECFVDPCQVTDCPAYPNAVCEADYCGGCYADFYQDGQLITDCTTPPECFDLSEMDFGFCDMLLGVGFTNGFCQYLSGCGWDIDGVDYSNAFFNNMTECENTCTLTCDEIEATYENLNSGEAYASCDYDNDCIAVWGDCDVGLGGCHYSVNEENYPEEEINELVDDWISGECMMWVCDCSAEPYAQCIDGTCTSAYCMSENPAGCVQTGCDEGYECIVDPYECVPTWCGCDGFYGDWFCTEDCGGGTCVEIESDCGNGDVTGDGSINILDVVATVNIILSADPPTEYELCSADMNSDGAINVLDIVMMVEFILNPLDTSYLINSGTSYGMCWGYCIAELDLQGTDADFEIYGWLPDPEFPTLLLNASISVDEWNTILDSFDFDAFIELQDVYGCPDCADGGSEWIEINHDGVTKHVTFEAYNTIPGHQELVIQLRDLRANFYNILDSWGE